MADEPTGTEGTEGGAAAPEPTQNEPAGSSQGKTFTQEELDAIVQHRLARERAAKADYEELKAKAVKLDELEAANKTDLEKAQAEAEAAKVKLAELTKSAHDSLIKSAVIAEAAKLGATAADAVYRALDKTGLTVADDGTVSGVEEAVKALLAEVPAFVGGGRPTGSADQGARGGSPDQMTQEQYDRLSPEEQHAALMSGKINHLL